MSVKQFGAVGNGAHDDSPASPLRSPSPNPRGSRSESRRVVPPQHRAAHHARAVHLCLDRSIVHRRGRARAYGVCRPMRSRSSAPSRSRSTRAFGPRSRAIRTRLPFPLFCIENFPRGPSIRYFFGLQRRRRHGHRADRAMGDGAGLSESAGSTRWRSTLRPSRRDTQRHRVFFTSIDRAKATTIRALSVAERHRRERVRLPAVPEHQRNAGPQASGQSRARAGALAGVCVGRGGAGRGDAASGVGGGDERHVYRGAAAAGSGANGGNAVVAGAAADGAGVSGGVSLTAPSGGVVYEVAQFLPPQSLPVTGTTHGTARQRAAVVSIGAVAGIALIAGGLLGDRKLPRFRMGARPLICDGSPPVTRQTALLPVEPRSSSQRTSCGHRARRPGRRGSQRNRRGACYRTGQLWTLGRQHHRHWGTAGRVRRHAAMDVRHRDRAKLKPERRRATWRSR